MERLYFIAILPPTEVQKQITGFKHYIAEQFGSRHALNAPPHITLHMPFRWKDKKRDQLVQVMTWLNEGLVPFEVKLKDFDFFEPRVVYVNVVANELLDKLQWKVVDSCRKDLKLDNSTYKNQGFHPHLTIGFRDLKKPMFYKRRRILTKDPMMQRLMWNRFHFSSITKKSGKYAITNIFSIFNSCNMQDQQIYCFTMDMFQNGSLSVCPNSEGPLLKPF